MPKHAQKTPDKKDSRKVIRLGDYRDRETIATLEYEDEEPSESQREAVSKVRVPKAVYRVAVILLALVLALVIWLNREWLSPGNLADWVRMQFMGQEVGEGFPYDVSGMQVPAGNFVPMGGDVLLLNSNALTRVDISGREKLTLSHGFNQPVLRTAGSRILLYNQGDTGYRLLSGTRSVLAGDAEKEIIAGAVAPNGRSALGLESDEGSSALQVFLSDGTLQYTYRFSKDYITAIALEPGGTRGLVCTVRSRAGELISAVTVLDFSREEPVSTQEFDGMLLIDAYWGDGGTLYALGDTGLLISGKDFSFTRHDFEGKNLTAFTFAQDRAFVTLSAYTHGGTGVLEVFSGAGEPVTAELPARPVSVSASGSVAGVLMGDALVFLDAATGERLGSADAGADARSVALSGEKTAYVLGVSQVRAVSGKEE